MKSACLLLILYSLSMVGYGALEMAHDFLHYLSTHHHSSIHSHSHGHHHSVNDHHVKDHHHTHLSHAHNEEEDSNESLTTPINFLYVELAENFNFSRTRIENVNCKCAPNVITEINTPPIPPPENFS